GVVDCASKGVRMSIAQARGEIERFLGSEIPEVLCFKGKWGVGKTYTWNEFLKNAKAAGGIALKRYSYVSLFGLGTIEQLKLALVENTIARERIRQSHQVWPSTGSIPARRGGARNRNSERAFDRSSRSSDLSIGDFPVPENRRSRETQNLRPQSG